MKHSAPAFGCFALMILLVFVFIIPFLLINGMVSAVEKLGIRTDIAILIIFGIFIGGLFNIPVKKIPREEEIEAIPFSLFGMGRIMPFLIKQRTYTLIAVNVGGCLIPAGLALYEIGFLIYNAFKLPVPMTPISCMILSTGINIVICYKLAKPIPNRGIGLNPFIPGVTAAMCAVLFGLFLPGKAVPIAYIAGVLGPIIGADLLHIKDIKETRSGMASIGGAGTFDGIVISGLIATLLA